MWTPVYTLVKEKVSLLVFIIYISVVNFITLNTYNISSTETCKTCFSGRDFRRLKEAFNWKPLYNWPSFCSHINYKTSYCKRVMLVKSDHIIINFNSRKFTKIIKHFCRLYWLLLLADCYYNFQLLLLMNKTKITFRIQILSNTVN